MEHKESKKILQFRRDGFYLCTGNMKKGAIQTKYVSSIFVVIKGRRQHEIVLVNLVKKYYYFLMVEAK